MCEPCAHTENRVAFFECVFQATGLGIYYFFWMDSQNALCAQEGGTVIRAVLFDLDDTLLRLNLTAFIARYVAGAA